MNAVRVLAETGDTVTLSRTDFEAPVRAREDAIYNAAEKREARLGEAAARMLDGEHPLKV